MVCRIVSLAPLLLALVASGCLEEAGGAGTSGEASVPADLRAEHASFLFSQPAAVVGAPDALGGSVAFDVPAGVARLEAEVDWECTTNCPLALELVDPEGAVRASASGGGVPTLEVSAPQSGAWTFRWAPRDGATVGIDGRVMLTILVAA